jgi:hypothetical protein
VAAVVVNGNGQIPLHNLSDRELLLLAVQRLNEVAADSRAAKRRLDDLEEWRDRALGVLALAGLLIPVVVTVAIKVMFP